MSNEKANIIASYFKKEKLKKGELLIKEGKTSKNSYFIEAGIIRCYIIDLNGNEVTTRFFSAPDFLNDYLSFLNKNQAKRPMNC